MRRVVMQWDVEACFPSGCGLIHDIVGEALLGDARAHAVIVAMLCRQDMSSRHLINGLSALDAGQTLVAVDVARYAFEQTSLAGGTLWINANLPLTGSDHWWMWRLARDPKVVAVWASWVQRYAMRDHDMTGTPVRQVAAELFSTISRYDAKHWPIAERLLTDGWRGDLTELAVAVELLA